MIEEQIHSPHRVDIFGKTPLHYATAQNHKEVVRLLIENGADVNATAMNGIKPLHCARAKDVSHLLIDNGADPDLGIWVSGYS